MLDALLARPGRLGSIHTSGAPKVAHVPDAHGPAPRADRKWDELRRGSGRAGQNRAAADGSKRCF